MLCSLAPSPIKYWSYYSQIDSFLNRAALPFTIANIDNDDSLSDQEKSVEKADGILALSAMWSKIPPKWRKPELWNFSNQIYRLELLADYEAKFPKWIDLGKMSVLTKEDKKLLENYQWFSNSPEQQQNLQDAWDSVDKRDEARAELDEVLKLLRAFKRRGELGQIGQGI